MKRTLISQRNEFEQPTFVQAKTSPDERPDNDRKEDRESWIAGAHVRGNRAAQIACQQNRAEDGRPRNQIEHRTGKQHDPEGEKAPSEYPSRTVPSTTGAGFTSFMMPSKSRNSADRALIMRPAQSLFFDKRAF
jgi:hypothetical protein